jgi:hypothetical protein
MKQSYKKLFIALTAGVFAFSASTFAQEESTESASQNEISIEMGLDIYSSYVWRGLKFGSGPAFQPFIELQSNNFTLGAWNNTSAGADEAFEINLYASYAFPFGVTIGITDYFGDGNVLGTNFNNLYETHSFEPFLSYEYGDLTFFGGLMFYEDENGKTTQDFYGEILFAFEQVDLAIGAGDGQYVTSPQWGTVGEFAICNITISKEKTIKISESFSLPMKGAITLNPYNERFFAYIGISL